MKTGKKMTAFLVSMILMLSTLQGAVMTAYAGDSAVIASEEGAVPASEDAEQNAGEFTAEQKAEDVAAASSTGKPVQDSPIADSEQTGDSAADNKEGEGVTAGDSSNDVQESEKKDETSVNSGEETPADAQEITQSANEKEADTEGDYFAAEVDGQENSLTESVPAEDVVETDSNLEEPAALFSIVNEASQFTVTLKNVDYDDTSLPVVVSEMSIIKGTPHPKYNYMTFDSDPMWSAADVSEGSVQLEAGEYQASFSVPSPYYNKNTLRFTVSEDGSVSTWGTYASITGQTITLLNRKQKIQNGREITFKAVDEDGNFLPGAELTIFDWKNQEYRSWTSGDSYEKIDGFTWETIEKDGQQVYPEYTLTETKAPAGYRLAESVTFNVTAHSVTIEHQKTAVGIGKIEKSILDTVESVKDALENFKEQLVSLLETEKLLQKENDRIAYLRDAYQKYISEEEVGIREYTEASPEGIRVSAQRYIIEQALKDFDQYKENLKAGEEELREEYAARVLTTEDLSARQQQVLEEYELKVEQLKDTSLPVEKRTVLENEVRNLENDLVVLAKDTNAGHYSKAEMEIQIEILEHDREYFVEKLDELKKLYSSDDKKVVDVLVKEARENSDALTDVRTDIESVRESIREIDVQQLEKAHIVVLDKDGNTIDEWDSTGETHTIEGLKAGETYTVVETKAPDGYTVTTEKKLTIGADGSVDTNQTDLLQFTDTFFLEDEVETMDIQGRKIWDDDQNRDGSRPESITVKLLADGEETASTTVSAQGGWTYSFDSLRTYRDGKKITYTVEESDVPAGYTSSVNGYDITNTYETEKTSVSGRKIWEDQDNKYGKRPASVKIMLLADGKETVSAEVSADNDWKYSFEDLPVYQNGTEISYSVVEVDVPSGYTSTVNGFDIVNTFNEEAEKEDGEDTEKDAGKKAEKKSGGQKASKTTAVNTGDDSNAGGAFAAMLISVTVLLGMMWKKKHNFG